MSGVVRLVACRGGFVRAWRCGIVGNGFFVAGRASGTRRVELQTQELQRESSPAVRRVAVRQGVDGAIQEAGRDFSGHDVYQLPRDEIGLKHNRKRGLTYRCVLSEKGGSMRENSVNLLLIINFLPDASAKR